MIYNPTSITQILSSQSPYIDIKYGQMFYFTDVGRMFYDSQDGRRVYANDIYILQFERQRTNFVPNQILDNPTEPGMEPPSVLYQINSVVYVVETNSLYNYKAGIWTTMFGTYGNTVVANTYYPNGTLQTIYPDDVTTNGILNNGSVVIRDGNKMICGLLNSDGYTMNVKSLIGGCLNIDPSGEDLGNGCLQLTTDTMQPGNANLNANLYLFGDLKIVPQKYWNRQYRLVTENITIISNSVITEGSIIKAGSKLGDITYSKDTVLEQAVTTSTGYITQNSKLYKNSVINGQSLVPPFLFDLPEENLLSYAPIVISSNELTINKTSTVLQINTSSPFKNTGDACYIDLTAVSLLTGYNYNKLEKIVFLEDEREYNIDYKASEGVSNTAKIVFYAFNNTVKVLP